MNHVSKSLTANQILTFPQYGQSESNILSVRLWEEKFESRKKSYPRYRRTRVNRRRSSLIFSFCFSKKEEKSIKFLPKSGIQEMEYSFEYRTNMSLLMLICTQVMDMSLSPIPRAGIFPSVERMQKFSDWWDQKHATLQAIVTLWSTDGWRECHFLLLNIDGWLNGMPHHPPTPWSDENSGCSVPAL